MGPKAYQQTSNPVIRNSSFERIYLIIIFLKLNKSSLIFNIKSREIAVERLEYLKINSCKLRLYEI